MKALPHLDARGRARMVDVGGKPVTRRIAVAEATVSVSAAALRAVRAGRVPKGDVASVARVAGIMAAKRVPELIPLCHPVALDACAVDVDVSAARGIRIRASASTQGRTGVEMEALTAASVAALAVYDMCKSLDRGAVISEIRLLSKSGGRSGSWSAPPRGAPLYRSGRIC